MLKDGLWDVYNDVGMGVCAELCAEHHSVTREQQDDYAVQSFERGIAAQDAGAFAWEIVPVEVSGGRGRPSTIVDKDEGLGKSPIRQPISIKISFKITDFKQNATNLKFDAAKLRKLRPSFKETGGTVTAGNASSISDGAAALVLAPELFTTAPALAIPKAISNAGLNASQVDYYEINEAFAVVALANQKLLGLTPEKVNVHGGAVSLGHPLGCSGARILVTLLGVLKQKNGKYGVGGVCNGGGVKVFRQRSGLGRLIIISVSIADFFQPMILQLPLVVGLIKNMRAN
ncbi:UNVERIFIED_CONTAM: Acetyl-CoA acetyltransferase, cytosolic 1 [Sesamum radiatum]|uniref:Acetyl-CoA acetyltransferase, cytosolic 1 n=1 Tax=Sesamum radiatum TaxID=300843 RepID=A0AAW2KMS8_SESRA